MKNLKENIAITFIIILITLLFVYVNNVWQEEKELIDKKERMGK